VQVLIDEAKGDKTRGLFTTTSRDRSTSGSTSKLLNEDGDSSRRSVDDVDKTESKQLSNANAIAQRGNPDVVDDEMDSTTTTVSIPESGSNVFVVEKRESNLLDEENAEFYNRFFGNDRSLPTPTESPIRSFPTAAPSAVLPLPSLPTRSPTRKPTGRPTTNPTKTPTSQPTMAPTSGPTNTPSTAAPTTAQPTTPPGAPSPSPTEGPTANPTNGPTTAPTDGTNK